MNIFSHFINSDRDMKLVNLVLGMGLTSHAAVVSKSGAKHQRNTCGEDLCIGFYGDGGSGGHDVISGSAEARCVIENMLISRASFSFVETNVEIVNDDEDDDSYQTSDLDVH